MASAYVGNGAGQPVARQGFHLLRGSQRNGSVELNDAFSDVIGSFLTVSSFSYQTDDGWLGYVRTSGLPNVPDG